MTPPDDNLIDGISTMEDLDPEPAPRQQSLHMRELVLGLLLLTGVLGWAGYTWWRDATDSSNYAQGQQAVARYDWDSAFAYYSAAKGYKDADVRAANASEQIQTRDKEYKLARTSPQTGSAAEALLAGRAVQTVQPGYAEINTIVAQAEQQVYSEALSGTVVMRQAADPPGLYYRNATSWVYLPGSDRWSSLQSYDCADRVIYDVPGVGWTPPPPNSTPTPPPRQMQDFLAELKGRSLMQVAVSDLSKGQAPAAPLSLDPTSYFSYICGEAGVWGAEAKNQSGPTINLSHTQLPPGPYVYEAYNSPVTSTVALTGTPGTVVGVGMKGRHVLLAAYGEPIKGAPVAQIYLAAADGSTPRVVYSTTGTILDAKLSLDERYVFIVSDKRESSSKLVVSSLLEDVETGLSVPLAAVNFDVPVDDYLQGIFTISGFFMDRGIFAGKLMLAQTDINNHIKLSILDPANPGQVLKELTISGYSGSAFVVYQQADRRTLLIYDEGLSSKGDVSKAPHAYLHIIRAGAGESAAAIGLSSSASYTLTLDSKLQAYLFLHPKLADGNLIYEVGKYDQETDQQTNSVYSVPLAQPGEVSTQPQQIYSATWSPDDPREAIPSWYEGTGMLAYTDKAGTLHARLYNSNVDVTLEQGIGEIVGLDTYAHVGTLR